MFIPDPGSSSKNLSILTPKKAKKWSKALKNMIRVVHPGSRIRMLTFSHPGSRIQGSKRHPIPDPGSGSATLAVHNVGYANQSNGYDLDLDSPSRCQE
jgi:hypothetical protein